MKILVIDDQRIFSFKDAVHATTSQRGLELLYESDEPWTMVFLDHDLGSDSVTSGSGIADDIAANQPKIDLIFCHSMNPVGRQYMIEVLRDAGYNVLPILWTNEAIQNLLDQDAMAEHGRNPFYQGPTR